MAKKQTPKADIDFEKDLWAAANELRGAVAENQYKDFVLSLLFVKHLSERYEMRRDEIQALFKDEKSDYYGFGAEEQNFVLEDEEEYTAKNVFKLPEEATWAYLQKNAAQDDIKVLVDKAFKLINNILEKVDEKYKGLLPPIFVKSQLTATQTAGIINLFSKKKFSLKANPQSDIIGRIYEYYLGRFAMAEGSGAGQFFTPGSVVRLLVEILQPFEGRIFDPACGSGGMFVQSIKFLQSNGGDKTKLSVHGQERYAGTLRLCKMNLLLRDLAFDVKLGDSLLNDAFPTLKADYILSNPPFNVKKWHAETLSDKDPRLFGPRDTFTTDGSANYMWMQTIWYHLSERGTAAVVMANGAMTTNTNGEKQVRQHMVDKNMVDCIIRLPDKLFLTTGIPACIFVLSKNRDGKDGEHRKRTGEVLFIETSKMGTMASRKLRVFSDEDLKKIGDTYHNWRNIAGEYEDVAGYCKSASIEEVKKQDYKLTPGIYVGVEEEEDDGIPFEEKMAGLKAKLKEQFAEANRLQGIINENLKLF